MGNGIGESPDRSTSPTPFLGFTTPSKSEVKKENSKVADFSAVRVSQPRTSKSRASLVWQKNGNKITIKEEPSDEVPQVKKHVTKDKPIMTTPKKQKSKIMKSIKEINKTVKVEKDLNKKVLVKTEKENSSERDYNEPGGSSSKSVPSTSARRIGQSQLRNAPRFVQRTRKQKFKTKNKVGFKCNQCGRVYKYLRGMRQHQKLECNVDPQFPCPYCPNKFRYRQLIREHVRVVHEQAYPKWYTTHYVIPLLKQENLSPI